MDIKEFLSILVFVISSNSFAKGMFTGEIPILSFEKKTWTYELKSIEATSSDPEKLTIDLSVERVSRGVYALSGEVFVNFDVLENEENMVGAQSFRSSTGMDDYKVLPFQIPKSAYIPVINTHYKEILMGTLKDCSDFPVFEDEFVPPFEKRTYTLTKCQFTQDGLPNHLQEGFYKIILYGVGEVEFKVELISEIISTI